MPGRRDELTAGVCERCGLPGRVRDRGGEAVCVVCAPADAARPREPQDGPGGRCYSASPERFACGGGFRVIRK